jgi:hypothetical protein
LCPVGTITQTTNLRLTISFFSRFMISHEFFPPSISLKRENRFFRYFFFYNLNLLPVYTPDVIHLQNKEG